ncbi:MAG: substrate-binding domain-containing protein [Desulfomonile tiedjei]|uniref:Substrate-binding domain-containing protein n=1 Tax=Desulfomonile tiedjei TaxID=2358 RepID=A0A9D6V5D6_9BACT|nr:substrate-binding domain-containing protein [Desulfomonile tiedjei]
MIFRNRIYIVLMAGVLAFSVASQAKAEDMSGGLLQELKKHIVQAIPREFVQEITKQFIEEIKKELAAEVKRELAQESGPGAMAAVMPQTNRLPVDNNGSDIVSMTAAVGKQLLLVKEHPGNHRLGQSPPTDSSPSERTLRAGLVAVVTNATNPVKTLTVGQVKRLFTGEYSNWNQVGGPDLPVKVVIWSENAVELEDLMKEPSSPDRLTLRYASLLIPAVDRTKGAIGFLTTRNVEQVEFVTKHEAIQKIAIRINEHSPAVNPGIGSAHSGSYPMMVDQIKLDMERGNPRQASARVSSGIQ